VEKVPENIEEIAFESMQGIVIATLWYIIIFGIAYLLEMFLPPFAYTPIIISAYGVKYILLFADIYLFVNAIYTEVRIGTKKINDYRKANI
jgi:hypothetical protein